MKTIDKLVRHMMPAYDLDNINFKNHISEEDPIKKFQAQINNIYSFAYVPKHLLRGAFLGVFAGSVASLITQTPLEENVRVGAVIGAVMDYNIFLYRLLQKYMETQTNKDYF